jgi:dTDP-glucose 4,6-dehydratase
MTGQCNLAEDFGGISTRLLVTGGLGFIGSNFIRYVLAHRPDWAIVNLDKVTYAGNPDNLRDIERTPRYRFVRGDICDRKCVGRVMKDVDAMVNFAAETHVDRSIQDPDAFLRTNILGTDILLEHIRKCDLQRFLQISTDEVYGSITKGSFSEDAPLHPSSPYAASKAAADLMALAFRHTYGIPLLITRSTNNYGPYQHPEKLVPLIITNAIENQQLPVYGTGQNVRDWLYVEDNCAAILTVLERGAVGGIFNVSSGEERTNIEVTKGVLHTLKKPESLIDYVKDRPGHDFRYSINSEKLRALGWTPQYDFARGIKETVRWYLKNKWWWNKIKAGQQHRDYLRKQCMRFHAQSEPSMVIDASTHTLSKRRYFPSSLKEFKEHRSERALS